MGHNRCGAIVLGHSVWRACSGNSFRREVSLSPIWQTAAKRREVSELAVTRPENRQRREPPGLRLVGISSE